MNDAPMTREDVERFVREAREQDARPSLYQADLRGVDLSDLDLSYLDLSGVMLRMANLRGARFYDTDLRGANLSGTDLSGSDMRGANLTGTNLFDANLLWAMGAVSLGHTPSGPARMMPLPNGTWRLSVGCWGGTTADLRTLIAGYDWPEAVGAEQDRRRPILATLADLADAQAAYHDDWLTAVVKRWGDKETTR